MVYENETNDDYEDFYKNKNLFGFSDYPLHSKSFDPANENVIGEIKDELKGKIICELIGLESETYSLNAVDGEEVKKAKGINKIFVKKIRHKNILMFCLIKK